MNKQKLKERKNKMRNSKGITLVALIITIIVLLILAVVAIAAVNDGGIIQKTQDAKSEHLIGQEKEEILLAHNGWSIQKYQPNEGFLKYMQTALAESAKEVTGNNNQVTITMKSNNKYTITEAGIIEGPLTNPSGGGGEIAGEEDDETISWIDNGDGSYTKGDTTITIGETTYTNAEVLAKLGIEVSEYTGTYGSIEGETWTVIGVEEDKIKLVSTKNVTSNVILGYNDPGAIVAVPLEEGEEEVTNATKLKRSIWSYNNAMNTIKTAVETATKGIPGTRSITMEDIEAKDILNMDDDSKKREKSKTYGRTYRYYYEGDEETGKVYSQYLDWNEIDTEEDDTTEKGWSEKQGGSFNLFKSYDGQIIDGSSKNRENVVKYKSSYYSMQAFKNNVFQSSLGTGNYWLASYALSCSASNVHFYVSGFAGDLGSYIAGGYLFNSNGVGYNYDYYGVRAVMYI